MCKLPALSFLFYMKRGVSFNSDKWIFVFRIRKSTYTRLEMLESGPLGTLIEELTLKDSLIGPLLTDEHVQAINRRLGKVMQTIQLCAEVKSWNDVLVPY